MNNLTIALACLGAIVLAGVVAHGAWQARKIGPIRPLQPHLPEHRDPVFTDQADPVLADPEVAALEPANPPAPKCSAARIDALIDAIATLTLDSPISGDMLLAHLPTTRRAGTKPFAIEGLNTTSGEWEFPLPGQRYRELQAGVQLANRTGALNEIEYSEFIQKIQAFAENTKAMADFPDMLDVVARGRELDTFASDFDAQLAVHLRAKTVPWSVGYVQQHGTQHGFVASLVHGRLTLPSPHEGAPPLLTLCFDPQAALAEDPNQTSLKTVTLNFDVPQTPASQNPFALWQASAVALAKDMDADIVDDQGHPIAQSSFTAIGTELEQLYTALQARDLGAGSASARRLFA
jgi:hypothetical protein